jgi:hypothetical protein
MANDDKGELICMKAVGEFFYDEMVCADRLLI